MEVTNPYEPPKASLGETAERTNDLSSFIEAYIDQNVDYYKKYIPNFFSGKRVLGFNFAAAIFTVPWLAYRKMYVFLMAYIPIPVLAPFLLAYLSQLGLISNEMIIFLFAFLLIALRVGIGFYINYFYLKKAKVKSQKMADKIKEGKDLSDMLALAGGTSSLACMLAIALSSVVSFISKIA
jgi:hypothetical protein